jgi:hypothetical protein
MNKVPFNAARMLPKQRRLSKSLINVKMMAFVISVSNQHRFDVDPDPTFCLYANPDPDNTLKIGRVNKRHI